MKKKKKEKKNLHKLFASVLWYRCNLIHSTMYSLCVFVSKKIFHFEKKSLNKRITVSIEWTQTKKKQTNIHKKRKKKKIIENAEKQIRAFHRTKELICLNEQQRQLRRLKEREKRIGGSIISSVIVLKLQSVNNILCEWEEWENWTGIRYMVNANRDGEKPSEMQTKNSFVFLNSYNQRNKKKKWKTTTTIPTKMKKNYKWRTFVRTWFVIYCWNVGTLIWLCIILLHNPIPFLLLLYENRKKKHRATKTHLKRK